MLSPLNNTNQPVLKYNAAIESPCTSSGVGIAIWTSTITPTEAPEFHMKLALCHEVVFRTADPHRFPLPHPALLQLHAVWSHILAVKAAAGYPHPEPGEYDYDAVGAPGALYS